MPKAKNTLGELALSGKLVCTTMWQGRRLVADANLDKPHREEVILRAIIVCRSPDDGGELQANHILVSPWPLNVNMPPKPQFTRPGDQGTHMWKGLLSKELESTNRTEATVELEFHGDSSLKS
ncbi:hypothetical protein B0H11DRAFT_1937135 [Mycena galericulata]|nr:hypothetical protein B0H11DRAFT_1937135 [Mycena galericulata]